MTDAFALILGEKEAANFVSMCLDASYGSLPSTLKLIARAGNVTVPCAKNWRQALVCPHTPSFLRLAMKTPQLNAATMFLMRQGEAHAEAEKLLQTMEETYSLIKPRNSWGGGEKSG